MVVSRSSGVVSIESSTSSPLTSRTTMLSKANLRRRRSKGTIAGFASSNSVQVGDEATKAPEKGTSTSIASTSQGNPQTPESSSLTNKPCHSAKLALMCCQNVIRMGARTQLGLCPPGKSRRSLKAALRQKSKTMRTNFDRRSSQIPADTGGYFGVDRMVGAASLESYPAKEEEFLMSTNTYDMESDEEASSGDDDDLLDIDELLKEDSPALDDERKYEILLEPLFAPNGSEGPGGAGPMSRTGGDGGKLPFNRRKLRYFDSISAADKLLARSYLQVETRKSKQNHAFMITKQLRRVQREQKRKLIEARGGTVSEALKKDTDTRDAIHAGVSRFEHPMTPSAAAALLVESLALNPYESVEGMAKCYEGIVAAGVALLDSNRNDPTSPASHLNNDRPMATRREIVAALTPLLITSLEQTSGEVILGLARLRRMCGTARYQRRFVQRVVPSLIRPPNGAIWCLKHQNDMEPILAAAELMFDCAMQIFSKGWYERGQLLLADTKRAKTLNTAAMQLRNLNASSEDHLTLGGGSLMSHAGWRTAKYKGAKDSSKGSSDHLAEWEVIAVDRQIKISISNLISTEWPKVVPHAKESDAAKAMYRSRSNSMRTHSRTASGDASPKPMVAPPAQSPARGASTNIPKSPHGPPAFPTTFPPDTFSEHAFPTSFPPAFNGNSIENHFQPPPPPPGPPTPPKVVSPTRDLDAGIVNDFSAPGNLFPPRSPKRDLLPLDALATGNSASPEVSRRKASPHTTPVREQSLNPAHGSPLHSQYDRSHLSPASPPSTSMDGSQVPQRPFSSAASIGSGTSASQSTHYRMVMSTAAERKRTVAACRALRSQILRFEDAFIQMHGRAPRGAAERAPLATTYAQYKEWKRAIRADAACRIQALIRGALMRGKLAKSKDARVRKVVRKRAGRSPALGFGSSTLEQLQIPAEIGEGDMQDDPFTDLAAKSQPLPPQWGSNQNIRRPRPSNDSFASPVPRAATASASSANEFNMASLSELQARKRDLKQQLKQYDMNFARRHKRMPVKAEKEPIRHLYEKYNALKSQISAMEQEGHQSNTSSPVAATPTTVLPQRTMSPVTSLEMEGDESPVGSRGKMKPARSPPAVAPAPVASSTAGPLSQDLAALKTEKGRLHQMLRSYEKDFYKEHKRQVSSFADIRPVANQYRRYKEIKKAIAALQQSGER